MCVQRVQQRRTRALERELRSNRVRDLRRAQKRGDVGRSRPLAARVAQDVEAGEGRVARRDRRDEELAVARYRFGAVSP